MKSSLQSNTPHTVRPRRHSILDFSFLRHRSNSFFSEKSATSETSTPALNNPLPPLPREVHNRIFQHLSLQQQDPITGRSCATCLLRDLSSYSLVCKNWHDGVIPNLYGKIWLSGAESQAMKKRPKSVPACRALLLRRTLLARPDYAAHIHELKLPEPNPATLSKSDIEKFQRIVASVIVCCPNLERFLGFYPYYRSLEDTGSFVQFALSTREELKEHIWIMGIDGPMQSDQSEKFISSHNRWKKLECLVLQGNVGSKGGSLNHLTFVGLFKRLPSLRKLLIARFHSYEFDNSTLLAIPELECLRLEDLPGVTDDGISAFLQNPSSKALRNFALLNMEILSLCVIAKLFKTLTKLQKFTLLQTSSPEPSVMSTCKIPFLSSSSVKFLHWDVLIPGRATRILARSILAGSFSALKTLRAPSDHHGTLQSVCRPAEKLVLPSDRTEMRLQTPNVEYDQQRYSRSLPQARINAQERIEAARSTIFMKIVVTDAGKENKGLEVKFPRWMGDFKSRVSYNLVPDLAGSEKAVLGVEDVVEWGVEMDGKATCCGKWNAAHLKGQRWWWHTERNWGDKLNLDRLF